MSTTIDEKVVSLQFDNQHFEKNVSTTMSTLDKLKQKLGFSGASKGLEQVNSAAKNVDMSGLGNGVETVRAKFSALEVMGVTALANITNSAVNAGKKIVSALTIDPIKTGFQEYETQINAVQTILANTESKGTTIDDVNQALDELNAYADKTIYNFTEMTKNIGTFTAAGVDLDTSVTAIQGIANLAAVSGSTSQQASTAMYQLSQALSSGTVKLMDWNSVVNAGMGGQVFQDALKETARVHGIAIDSMIEEQGSFRETLSEGWLTSEILTETLEKFTLTTEGLTEEQIAANREMLKAKGYTEAQIDEIFKLGATATDAATKVKTFTQLWDVLKEASQSGWTQTWEILVGDFEEAKSLLTPLSDFLTGIINTMSDWRNNILEGAFGNNPFTKMVDSLSEKLSKITGVADSVAESIDNTVSTIENLDEIARKVIRGDYLNTDTGRRENLMAEGYNWATVQNRVNEMLGNTTRHSEEAAEAELKLYKAEHGLTEASGDLSKSQESVNEARAETVEELLKMTDAELIALGLTQDEIDALRELGKMCEQAGIKISDFFNDTSLLNGRTLFINSFKNIGEGITEFAKIVGAAWKSVFPPKTVEERAEKLYGLIAAFHKFTLVFKNLIDDSGKLSETGDKIGRTLAGVFGIIKIISSVTGGVLKIGLKIIQELLKTLGYVNVDILGLTANIGEAIWKFSQWLEEHNLITKAIEVVVPLLVKMGKAIVDLIKAAWDLPIVQESVTAITNTFGKFKGAAGSALSTAVGWLSKLDNITLDDIKTALANIGKSIRKVFSNINDSFGGVPGDILSGLANGLKNGASTVWNAIVNLANTLVAKFEEVLGIESPSKVFMAIGGFIIAGLISGLSNGGAELVATTDGIVGKLTALFGNIDWSTIFTGGMSVGLLLVAKNLSDVVSNISAPLGGLGDTLSGTGEVLSGVGDVLSKSAGAIKKVIKNFALIEKSFAKVLKSVAFENNTKGIKNLAISLLMLVGAIAILTFLDVGKMWNAVGVIAALSAILVGLSFAIAKMGQASLSLKKGEGLQMNTVKSSLLTIGAALLLMAATVKMLGKMDPDEMKQGFLGLVGVILAIAAIFAAYGLLVKGKSAQNIDKAGKMMVKMGIALLLLVAVFKLVGMLDANEIIAGVGFLVIFGVFVAAMVAITQTVGKNIDKVGKMLIKLSIAMLLLIAVFKLAGTLKANEIIAGVGMMALLLVFIGILVTITKIGKEETMAKVSGTILAISAAMLLMGVALKIIGGMSVGAIVKGVAAITALSLIVAMLILVVKQVGNNAPKMLTTLLGISVALVVMTAAMMVLSLLKPEAIIKGLVAVGYLSAMLAMLILVTKNAQDVKGSIIGMAVAIGIMAVAIAALSFIDIGKLAAATLAMVSIMGMFALIINQSKNAPGSMKSLIVMTVAIGVLAGALFLIGQLPIENALAASASLSVLMLAMAGVLAIIAKLNLKTWDSLKGVVALLALCGPLMAVAAILSAMSIAKNVITNATGLGLMLIAMTVVVAALDILNVKLTNALKGVLALTALCVPLVAIAGILCLMNCVKDATISANALMTMLIAMTAVCVVLTAVGLVVQFALLGALALLALCVPLVAIAGILCLMNCVKDATTSVDALVTMLDAMTNVCVKLALVAPLALMGVAALTALTLLILGIGVLAVGIGALLTLFPQLETFIDTGIPILVKLATGLGEMISGFITGLGSGLPEIGAQLSAFMINAMPFIVGAKMVDEQVLAGIGILTGAILALTAADLIEGVVSFLNGGTSFATLGTELSNFILNAMPFIMLSKMIDPSIMEGVKSLAQAVLILTGANMLENVTKWLGGESSLATFGSQLGQLGTDLRTFVTNLGEFTEAQVTTVTCACDAIKALASAANEIPNEGGWAAKLLGENSLATFGSYLPDLGTNLNTFVTNLGTFTDAQVTTVTCACDAIKAIASAAGEIPNEGGLWASIVGDNSLATFAGNLPALGTHLNGFITNLGTFGDDSIATVNCVGEAIKTLANVAQTLPNEGGFWASIVGDNSLATFAGYLPDLGTNLNQFITNLGTFSEDSVSSVNAACKAITSIASVCGDDMDIGNVSDFGKKLDTLANKIKSFVSTITEIGSENISTAIAQVNKLKTLANTMAMVDLSSLNNFGEALTNVAKNIVSGFVKELSGATPKEDAKQAVKELINSAIDGAEEKETDVKTGFKSVGESAIDGLGSESLKTDAATVGKDLVTGFANGIKNNKYLATNAGSALGKAALEAAKAALDENSPSKEMYKVGEFAALGLTNALYDYESESYGAGYNIAEYARDGLSRALAKVDTLLNSEMETQPTIRPVLDLSEVTAGANSIGGLFGTQSIGVMSNLSAINSMMNQSSQNGVNADVVSAINKLRGELGNVGGNVYNVNGVTYDDGTNVSSAVESLVRAAKIARRV